VSSLRDSVFEGDPWWVALPGLLLFAAFALVALGGLGLGLVLLALKLA
jgi:hypothetical protein